MQTFKEQKQIRRKVVTLDALMVENKKIIIFGKFLKTARIEEEWYEDVEYPELIIRVLKRAQHRPDIFTFWQRFPESKPKYNYFMELEQIAVLPIRSYDYWYQKQADANVRRAIKKAEKNEVKLRMAQFDDEFIKGMKNIFNETPIRQGKPFWHFGKDFETIKREFSKYLYREDLIGAYHNGNLIGFMFLANAGNYAVPSQIISKIEHRDKAPNNALIAKAVEICEVKKIPYLVYFNWGDRTLAEFKRRNGFKKVSLPRYYIPLTIKGKAALKLHLHCGITGLIPGRFLIELKELRSKFYEWKYRRSQ
jgi:hypothetical protein